MRGTSSIANEVMPQSRRSVTTARSWPVGRNEIVVVPRGSRRITSVPSGWTETTRSAPVIASGSTLAPADTYSSSVSSACAPASGSTATSYPSPVSLPTSSGTIATRASPSRVSLATAIFTRRNLGQKLHGEQASHVLGVVIDASATPSGQLELLHHLVARAPARTLAEVRRHQADPVGGPARAGVAVEQADPAGDLGGVPEPGERHVRPEALAVDGDPGPRGGRARAGGQPVDLGAPGPGQVEAGPEDPRAADVREGAAAGDPCLERRTPGGRAREPLDELVEPPVLDRGEERQREVQLPGAGPPEGRRLPARLQEPLEVVDDLLGGHQGHEHPHVHHRRQPAVGLSPSCRRR